jgi:hypothetical protein
MSSNLRQSIRKTFLSAVAVLAGGSTFTSCDTKVRQAVVGGLETTFLSLFDISSYVDFDDGSSGLFD